MSGDRSKSYHSFRGDHQQASSLNRNLTVRNQVSHLNNRPQLNRNEVHLITAYLNAERLNLSLRKSLLFFAQLTTKLPLIVLLILIVMYAIPASAAILALYILITIVFAIPSVLVLYFAFPSLDCLQRHKVVDERMAVALDFIYSDSKCGSLDPSTGVYSFLCMYISGAVTRRQSLKTCEDSSLR
ncbi:hypothetical protein Q3G72_003772 [Acer saccharum]|nr:hypothetical protein Q3G72_003772 [Acer saccharum]